MSRIIHHPAAEDEPYILGVDPSKLQAPCYARDLRVIGQALEQQPLLFLEVAVDGTEYVARGILRLKNAAGTSMIHIVRDLVAWLYSSGRSPAAGQHIERQFTAAKIDQLDWAGRENRRDAAQTPDPHSLSQILRGAGAYLDKGQNVSLVGLTFEQQAVTLRYKTADGRVKEAKHDIDFFYNVWVKMYLRRSSRRTPQTGKGIVTWEEISKH